jgi:hypothetical protein
MNLRISTLGSKALQQLKASGTGAVWGTTSLGVFIHLPPRGMIFLSFETYRGPLSVNLEGDKLLLKEFKSGDPVNIADGKLVFSPSGLLLVWEDTQPWEVPYVPAEVLPYESLLKRYQEIRERIRALRAPSIPSLNFRLDQREVGLQSLLGKGSGLTPAGDDIVLGYLLTLKRWGTRFLPDRNIQALSQEMVSAAFRQTTLLSANLIACASEGQADERLVLVLDAIFTDVDDLGRCIDLLLNYGHSSSVGVLAGIGVAIEHLDQCS